MSATIIRGDARHLPLAGASVDAIVTDPPYELNFMGRAWDATGVAYDVDTWRECLRVLKPGGHLFAFGGTRTYHRMVCAIEDAGFEIRDSIHWIYGSGFPKSLDVSKAIDKAAGATRTVVGTYRSPEGTSGRSDGSGVECMAGKGIGGLNAITVPATPDAARWQGWGSALKPAHEPIVLARKPFPGTVAGNVLAHGTGALNIDGCRIEGEVQPRKTPPKPREDTESWRIKPGLGTTRPEGRWPTNVVLTHQPLLDDTGVVIGDACAGGCVPGCPVADMDAQSGTGKTNTPGSRGSSGRNGIYGAKAAQAKADMTFYEDHGGASRFFPVFRYEAKAPASERPRSADGTAHATVKPLALMRWLVRLVTQPGGLILDPFLGSGTTAEAALIEGFRCVGVELDPAHLELVTARLSKPIQPTLGLGEAS